MKLRKILESIVKELNVPKPEDAYPFDDIKIKDLGYGKMYTYIYTNNLNQEMEVTNMVTKLTKDPAKSIYVAFKKHDPNEPDEQDYDSEEEQEKKYSEKTGAKDLLKVLATVVEATKRTIKSEGGENKIYSILYSPSDKKRGNIYLHYIETLFKGFEKEPTKQGIFTKFVNKIFKD
jgi:hypothetical protein